MWSFCNRLLYFYPPHRLRANPQLTGQEAFQGHMQAHHPDCELSL
jgi:hypothetical protein